ncbi:SLC13 family permease [Thermogladius sp. 4427co]|uniref:SLC13 family permease n=1 Tax=Thermogladius sp. 4427co TaxID=3450718 RepID=UPI003F7B0096
MRYLIKIGVCGVSFKLLQVNKVSTGLSGRMIVGGLIVSLLLGSLIAGSRNPRIPVWSIMSFTAFITIALGLVKVDEVGSVIDWDVILFLIGMFSITGLAESSGLLDYLAGRFISIFKTRKGLIIGSSILFGLMASILMNDTIALMGPPIAYTIAKALNIDPRFMFLLLAFSLTIGSVMTPIGNPQNVLIAVRSGIEAPFVKFVALLSIPTFVNLVATPLVLMHVFRIRDGSYSNVLIIPYERIRNRRDALLAATGLVVTVISLILNDIFQILGLPSIEYRGFIPFIIAASLYIFTSNPRRTLSNVDWGTIVFFISMFITMEGVWRSGVLQPLLEAFLPASANELNFQTILMLSILSILGSQLVSNVPFTKLLISYISANHSLASYDITWITMAMSTTIAGNLTLLGAASNIIIIEYLESRMNTTIGFVDFLKAGLLVTLINLGIYLVFLYPVTVIT